MPKYHVTIGYHGTKTFEIEATNLKDATDHAQRQLGYLEHTDNPISEDVSESLVSVKPVLSKADAYIALYRYVMDMTDNKEPLDLLEQLKPE